MKKSDLIKFLSQKTQASLVQVELEGFGTVYIKPLTVADVEEQAAETKEGNRLARSIARVLCDAEGNRLLDPSSDEEVALIASQSWGSLESLRKAMEQSNAPKA